MAAIAVSENEKQTNQRRRVRYGSAMYNLICEVLIDEAAMLDAYQIKDWLDWLAPDILYSAPVRVTKMSNEEAGSIDRGTVFFHDDYDTLKLRVARLADTPSGWAEDPRSRTRRFISNVAAWGTDRPDEFEVTSNLLLARNRSDSSSYQWITAQRNDIVRLVQEDVLKLVRRETILDISVLGVPNLALFL